MEILFELIGELLTTTAITKELKYAGIALLLIIGIGTYLYLTD